MSQPASAPRIPSLRFPEFSGEWEEKKFGDVVSLSSSKHNSEKNKSVQKCIELEHIDQVTGRLLGFVEGNDFGSIKNKFNKNNVLFGKLRPYLRKYIKAPFDGVCSSEIWVLDGKLISNDYLYYLVQLERFIELADQSIGSKMPRADWSHVSSGIFLIPSLPEQTKIAAFLSAVDSKIDQLSQKKALLEQYKKGVMQQLFSQQIRFKADDGSDYPEWEEKKLGEVALVNPKSSPLPDEFYYIDLESVEKGKLLKSNLIEKIDAPSRAQRLLQKHDVIFQMVRPYQGNNYFFDLDDVFVASTGYAQIRTPHNAKYIYHFLHTEDFVTNVINRCTGSSYPTINSNDLVDIYVQLPCLEEQTKIANLLSVIDSKIEQVAQQLEAAKQFKKGLLQQMFV